MAFAFEKTFQDVFGQVPFPWQRALFDRLAKGEVPSVVNLPTGLGKTSMVALWLLALAAGAKVPRRLVYVVNRRTVVDQTTREVEKLVENLAHLNLPKGLAVSTLRGQRVDNRAWSSDPSRPAVICGTVDMIGSRLLFSGYGAGFRTRPLYAGFLGQDSLFIHDEAHLEPAFQKLLEGVEAEQRRAGDPWPLKVMALTATSRAGGSGEAFGLTSDDLQSPMVAKRVRATKKLHFHAHGARDLPDLAVKRALAFRDSGSAVLVFLRTVDDVMKAVELLRKGGATAVEVLAGTMRGRERDRLVKERPVFQRFLPERDRGAVPESGTVYLVSTSAGEVGVNLSADHLICDLSTFDSMAQRFGRVNRFGERSDTEVHVFHPLPDAFDAESRLDQARRKTLDLLLSLKGDASPHALGTLDAHARKLAFTPEPKCPRLDEMVMDAWSMTTIRAGFPGRPAVAPYLHGISEWEPPQTSVAWRDEVEWMPPETGPVGRGKLLGRYDAAELLESYPLKAHELLTDRTSRVVSTLFDAVEKREELLERHVWVVRDLDVQVLLLETVLGRDRKRAEATLAGATLILPASSWHPVDGFLRSDWEKTTKSSDVSEIDFDPAAAGAPVRGRVRSDDSRATLPNGSADDLRRIRTVILSEPSDAAEGNVAEEDSGDNGRYWIWYEAAHAADNEGSRSGRRAVLLDVHLGDVENRARDICAGLPIEKWQKEAVALAGALHDLGKRRRVWQRGIGNASPPPILAKAASSVAEREGLKYRHELGSILDARTEARLLALEPDQRELVLHMVATHHGRARPHFPTDELFDPEVHSVDFEQVGVETVRRFARLQHRFGRWGLAYLESLLRAADYAASANPSAEVP